jgi:ABC-type cobalamin/Fe3+-siderophores transport system ATPase subunit
VPQQDVLPPMLTVYEALLFAARLRLPESIPDEEKISRVEVVIDKLGIKSIRDSRIGSNISGGKRGISGGEMRRVSIGLELLAKPDVLILDEPTSGLPLPSPDNSISSLTHFHQAWILYLQPKWLTSCTQSPMTLKVQQPSSPLFTSPGTIHSHLQLRSL